MYKHVDDALVDVGGGHEKSCISMIWHHSMSSYNRVDVAVYHSG
jgi:hypothetical protein